jgi:hypothetical protein
VAEVAKVTSLAMNPIDDAINNHIDQQTAESLDRLYAAFLAGRVLIATDGDPTPLPAGATRVRAACIKNTNGQMCLPAFTSYEHFLEWKPEDPPSVEMSGFTLFQMASTMAVEWIVVNHRGVPQGQFSRAEIRLLAAGMKPKN